MLTENWVADDETVFDNLIELLGLLVVDEPESVHAETNHTETVFWNASTWEGQNVRIVKIWLP